MKRQIPNLITLCNLLCGILASWVAVRGRLDIAAYLILLGIVFDFFDGLAARLLHVSSPLGKELDSLADVVTSGVAPGFIFMSILWHADWGAGALVALLIPLFAAYRLAKFNIDTRQSHSFIGLPVPSNALIWVAMGIAFSDNAALRFSVLPTQWLADFCFDGVGLFVLLAVELVGCVLMVSEVPLFGLKFKNLSWHDNKLQFLFLGVDVLLLVLLGIMAFPIIILWYIVLSLCCYKALPSDEASK